jgi:hypothetical protein
VIVVVPPNGQACGPGLHCGASLVSAVEALLAWIGQVGTERAGGTNPEPPPGAATTGGAHSTEPTSVAATPAAAEARLV